MVRVMCKTFATQVKNTMIKTAVIPLDQSIWSSPKKLGNCSIGIDNRSHFQLNVKKGEVFG